MHHPRRSFPSRTSASTRFLVVALAGAIVAGCDPTSPGGSLRPSDATGSGNPVVQEVGTQLPVPPSTGVVGVDWRRVPLPDEVVSAGWMYDVLATSNGLVAVGETKFGTPVHWTSGDGVRWQLGGDIGWQEGSRHDGSGATVPGPQWLGGSNLMLASGDGGLVLLSGDRDAWTSDDGADFAPVARMASGFGDKVPGLRSGQLLDVVASEERFLAISSSRTEEYSRDATPPILWRSTERQQWTPQAMPGDLFTRGETVLLAPVLAADGPAVLVAGRQHPYGRDGDVQLLAWASADGQAWQRSTLPTKRWPEPLDAAMSGGRSVIVGAELVEGSTDNWRDAGGGRAVAWLGTGETWYRAPLEAELPDAELTVAEAVVPLESGFAAVGWAVENGATRAMAWRSGDGLTWSASPISESPSGGPFTDEQARAVTTFHGGLVAVGTDLGRAAVWVSGPFAVPPRPAATAVVAGPIEGSAWAALERGPGLHDAAIDGLTRFGDGFVAVGRPRLAASIAWSPWTLRPSIWLSDDGRTWERLDPTTIPPAARPTRLRWRQPFGFEIATDGRRIVIVEQSGHGWTSADGRTWEAFGAHASGIRPVIDLHPTKAAFVPTSVEDIAAVPGGFVGVGTGCLCHEFSSGYSTGASWASEDGERWVAGPFDEASLGGLDQTWMTSVVGHRGAIVAAGWRLRQSGGDALAWRSEDGLRWTRVDLREEGHADLAMLASDGIRLLMVIALDNGGLVRTSADGLTWSEPARLPGNGVPSAVAADDAGFVIAGSVERSSWDDGLVVWRSADGRAWQPELVPTDGERERAVSAVVLAGSHVVLAGGGPYDAAIWLGPR